MPKFIRDDIGGLPPDATELYYTIQVKNNNTGFDINGNPTEPPIPVPIVFQETRSNPYINPAGDYYMSVLSFEVDTEAIPLFICDAVPGSDDINQTPYYITILNNTSNIAVQGNISWVPEDNTAVIPPQPVPDNYDNYPYYYAYTFQHFINLVNNILLSLAKKISITNPPFLVLKDNQLSLVGELTNFNSSNPRAFTIFFNTELYNLFSSLPAKKIPELSQPIGTLKQCNYQLIMQPYASGSNLKTVYTSLTFPLTDGYTAIYSDAEYSPFPFWNPVDSIVFTTQQLTAVPELIAKPVAFGPNNIENVGTNAESYYILTDYSSPLKTGTEYKPNISYQPIAEFRLCDLYGDQALNALRISVFWKDKFGEIHPLYLEAGGTAYIKILFRKKTYYVDKEKK